MAKARYSRVVLHLGVNGSIEEQVLSDLATLAGLTPARYLREVILEKLFASEGLKQGKEWNLEAVNENAIKAKAAALRQAEVRKKISRFLKSR